MEVSQSMIGLHTPRTQVRKNPGTFVSQARVCLRSSELVMTPGWASPSFRDGFWACRAIPQLEGAPKLVPVRLTPNVIVLCSMESLT